MRIVIGGPFSMYDEMKELAEKLEELEGADLECTLPRYSKGFESADKIEEDKRKLKQKEVPENFQQIAEVEWWFLEQISEAELLILHNKKVEGDGETLEGYMGINATADFGFALGQNLPIIFTNTPSDVGLKALTTFSEQLMVMNKGRILEFFEEKESLKDEFELRFS